MNGWQIGLLVYAIMAVLTFLPVLWTIVRGTGLQAIGPTFVDSVYFSDGAKERLVQNYERTLGTLRYWRNQVSRYQAFHVYAVVWISLSTVAVPFLTQAVSGSWSKWCVSVIAAYAALLLALSRAFRVEDSYRAFRRGEAEFYDLVRRLLDDPGSFGSTEDERLHRYFAQVAAIRRAVRSAETDGASALVDAGAGRGE
jgi:ABC-type long-subunit fatty acid transport system fused permease/ATPase subunit